MIFLIYTILVILQLYKGIATVVPDPCPSDIKNSDIVADMCKSSSATEETSSGDYKVDSVVLRIMTQQDDCICRVTLDNQKESAVVVGLRKFEGFQSSAPVEADCGLAVDINHIPDMSTGNVITPIECLVNGTRLHTSLFQKSYLQFRSRIINGDFIRGFCMRIIRDSNSDHSQVLRIVCDAPMTTEQTTEEIETSDASQSSPQTPVAENSTAISSTIDSTTTVTTAGMATMVQDPCPDYMKNSDIVVDMCMSSSATEETYSGGYKVDSVVLRIMMQQNNCICRVALVNQKENPVVVGLSKFDGFVASAPEKADCGLAVDINHIPDLSTGNVIAPIECLVNGTRRHIPLFQKSYLQFRSRIINGDFIRGFCIRIIRDINSDHSQVLRIVCDAPMTTEQTTEKITTSDAPQSSTQTPVSEKLTTNSSNIYTTTTVTTEKSTTISSTIDSTTTVKHQSIATTTDTTTVAENDKTTYIALSAFSSTVAMILLIALVLTCIRYRAILNARRTNENENNSNRQVEYNRHYCDLTNNRPNVPGQEYDNIDSNYNTIDANRSQSSNNVVRMEGEYVSVEPDGNLTTNIN